MAQKVVLLTGNHLCHNPRAFKSATTLARQGFDVEILGMWFDAALKARDQHLVGSAPFKYTPVLDLTESKWESLQRRARGKIGHVVHKFLKLENGWQIGVSARFTRSRGSVGRDCISRIPSRGWLWLHGCSIPAVAWAWIWRIGFQKTCFQRRENIGRWRCCARSSIGF
jgi:hypothetical protein